MCGSLKLLVCVAYFLGHRSNFIAAYYNVRTHTNTHAYICVSTFEAKRFAPTHTHTHHTHTQRERESSKQLHLLRQHMDNILCGMLFVCLCCASPTPFPVSLPLLASCLWLCKFYIITLCAFSQWSNNVLIKPLESQITLVCVVELPGNRQTNSQTSRQTNKLADRQKDRQTERQTVRQSDKRFSVKQLKATSCVRVG